MRRCRPYDAGLGRIPLCLDCVEILLQTLPLFAFWRAGKPTGRSRNGRIPWAMALVHAVQSLREWKARSWLNLLVLRRFFLSKLQAVTGLRLIRPFHRARHILRKRRSVASGCINLFVAEHFLHCLQISALGQRTGR
jgi:hypothetical protein